MSDYIGRGGWGWKKFLKNESKYEVSGLIANDFSKEINFEWHCTEPFWNNLIVDLIWFEMNFFPNFLLKVLLTNFEAKDFNFINSPPKIVSSSFSSIM